MFIIKTYIKVEKEIKVFAKRAISKGSVVWEYLEGLDNKISSEEVRKLNLIQRDFVYKYFFKRDGVFYSSCDYSIFIRKSSSFNCKFKDDCIFAIRDIFPDEELILEES